MPTVRMPETLSLRLRAGWTDRIERASERADQAAPEWGRAIIRTALESSERMHRRRTQEQGCDR